MTLKIHGRAMGIYIILYSLMEISLFPHVYTAENATAVRHHVPLGFQEMLTFELVQSNVKGEKMEMMVCSIQINHSEMPPL